MKEKNYKNVSLRASLAPSSLLEGQERATGDAGLKSWGQNPEKPMPGREIDYFLPSPPPWRVLFMFRNCDFCRSHNVAMCWRREALPTQGFTVAYG